MLSSEQSCRSDEGACIHFLQAVFVDLRSERVAVVHMHLPTDLRTDRLRIFFTQKSISVGACMNLHCIGEHEVLHPTLEWMGPCTDRPITTA